MKVLNGAELAGYVKERQARVVRSAEAVWGAGVVRSAEVARSTEGVQGAQGAWRRPKLVIVRDSDNPVITKYVQLKMRYGADIGVEVEDYRANDASEIAKKIRQANRDEGVDGIIIQLPIKDSEETTRLCDMIAPDKDVDGLGSRARYDSATATAILWLLAGYDIGLAGKKIALVGRGKLVGGPLSTIFAASQYDYEMFHRGSDLTKLKEFDIIISATGVPGLVLDAMVKPGAVVVDAGTASEDGVLKGDVDDSVRRRDDLDAITPVVGGVGPLTIACLFEHVLQAYEKRKR